MNSIKIFLGKQIRKIVIMYYKLLGVSIGKNCFISHHATIDTTYPGSIVISDGCYITSGAKLIAHDHSVYRHVRFSEDDGRGKILLKKNVFIGANAIVLRNVTIGENAIVAAGAVVTDDVPDNCIVAGNPARVIKTFIPINK